MTQEKIDFLQNTKENWRLLLGRVFCQLVEQLRPKMGNPLAFFWFLSTLLILCIRDVKKYIMAHDKINSMYNRKEDC